MTPLGPDQRTGEQPESWTSKVEKTGIQQISASADPATPGGVRSDEVPKIANIAVNQAQTK